ncbi:MAG: hypothetical protein AB1847_15450 [bacterium]
MEISLICYLSLVESWRFETLDGTVYRLTNTFLSQRRMSKQPEEIFRGLDGCRLTIEKLSISNPEKKNERKN